MIVRQIADLYPRKLVLEMIAWFMYLLAGRLSGSAAERLSAQTGERVLVLDKISPPFGIQF